LLDESIRYIKLADETLANWEIEAYRREHFLRISESLKLSLSINTEWEKALEYSKECLENPLFTNAPELKSEISRLQAEMHLRLEHYDDAHIAFENAVEVFNKTITSIHFSIAQ
jgi:hypothetical protein